MDHPLVQHKLHILRDKLTTTKQFRELVNELAILESYEAMRDFPLEDVEVETPLEKMTAKRIAGKKVAIIPILRAGLGMVDGVLELVPSARVGHVGMYRDPETCSNTDEAHVFPDRDTFPRVPRELKAPTQAHHQPYPNRHARLE